MRFAMMTVPGGAARPGIVDGDRFAPFPADVATLDAFVALAPAERAAAVAAAGPPYPLDMGALLAPLRPKKNVFCVGRNYVAHAEEAARARGVELTLPPLPTFFTKTPGCIIGPGEAVELEAHVSSQYDWEAELAVVIGTRCKDVAEADALDVVFGYTCLNDVTARDLQKSYNQWFKGKSLDYSCPLGPWIVDAAEFGDPQTVDVALHVNGERKQFANTRSMIFSVRQIIANLSIGMTLEPGDIIATGTPEGVGFARVPPEFLRDGDVMDVEVERIGVLRNGVRIRELVAPLT
jgi:2-keto-4-pentenoate hydratase/2-oxohepta-3-ene-1,7-dioic acid hydratase in catechol pathway